MQKKHLSYRLKTTVALIAMVTAALSSAAAGDGESPEATDGKSRIAGEYRNTVTADERARKARKGIIIIGSGKNTRAVEPYSGSMENALGYADIVNRYDSLFGTQAKVYCMVIPNAVEYYCPDAARQWTKAERPVIDGIYTRLATSVAPVDVYTTLGEHASEDIYSRTDHHWAPLGAYYAAQTFADVAGVPFMPLDSYEERTVNNYVGTMYRFSRDMSVKRAPEKFVYHVPRNVDFSTTYINYTLNADRTEVTSETEPGEGEFFLSYSDGSSGAYCTFMGGDTKTVSVRTSTGNGRRLLILKDSYGNALPGYLFGSFEEIHVVDCRYFTKNMTQYVSEKGITDILFANNLIHASMTRIAENYANYLIQ